MKWAQNKTKLQRVLDAHKGASEEIIKAEYIKIGGLVYDIPEVEVKTEEVKQSPIKKAVKKIVKKVVKRVTKK